MGFKMTELKLCKDCKFYEKHTLFFMEENVWSRCKHPKFTDPVDGKSGSYCSILRFYDCGQCAKYFEPKS